MRVAIDASTIDTLRTYKDEKGQSLLISLITLFSETVPGQVNELRVLFSQNDFEKLERAAHSLKSTCGNLGLTEMTDACMAIEHHILDMGSRAVDKGKLETWIKTLEATFKDAIEDLKKLA